MTLEETKEQLRKLNQLIYQNNEDELAVGDSIRWWWGTERRQRAFRCMAALTSARDVLKKEREDIQFQLEVLTKGKEEAESQRLISKMADNIERDIFRGLERQLDDSVIYSSTPIAPVSEKFNKPLDYSTHYVGDNCPGGHRADAPLLGEQAPKHDIAEGMPTGARVAVGIDGAVRVEVPPISSDERWSSTATVVKKYPLVEGSGEKYPKKRGTKLLNKQGRQAHRELLLKMPKKCFKQHLDIVESVAVERGLAAVEKLNKKG
jgi:hypothetical protein